MKSESGSFIRIISILMALLMVIQSSTVITFAEETEEEPAEVPCVQASAVEELTEKRTVNTKHFRMSDGTYRAVSYAVPVHYEEAGEWKEIDQSLVDENGRMKTKQSRTPVSFGCRAEDQLVTVGEGENALSFDLIGQQVSAPVEAPAVQAAEPQTGLSQQPAGRLENQVTYQNILESTDLTYDISADRLKESIILQEPGGPSQFQFRVTGDYTLVKMADNRVEVRRGEEAVYEIAAPYMFDAAGAQSEAVQVYLEPHSGYTLMTLAPDAAWLGSAERVYPVTLDPTVTISDVPELMVASGGSVISNIGPYDNPTPVYLGPQNGTTCDITMTGSLLAQFGSQLDESAYITQALLTLPMLYAGEGYSTLEATIHQKTAAGYDPAALDYFYRYAYEEVGQETFCSFYEGDITAAVIDWRENPSDNQGLVFKWENGSTEFLLTDLLKYISISVSYIVRPGINSSDSYTTQELDGIAAGMVNNLTGQVSLQFSDYSSNNIRSGYALSHVYTDGNLRREMDYPLADVGEGFSLSAEEFLWEEQYDTPRIEGVSESCSYFRYLDGGGNEYIFDYTADRIEGEDGTVTYTNGRYYCPRLPRCKLSFGGAYAYLTYESGVYKAFSGRFLRFIKDPNGNTVNFTYRTLPGGTALWKITEVVDGTADRVTELIWDEERSLLTAVKGADGTYISFTYTAGANPRLTQATYANRATFTATAALSGTGAHQAIQFQYGADGRLSEVSNSISGSKIVYSRSGSAVQKVTTYAKHEDAAALYKTGEIDFEYGLNLTKCTDRFHDDYYTINTFNGAGSLMSTTDSEGLSKFYNYEVDHNGWTGNVSLVSAVQSRDAEGENLIGTCQQTGANTYQFTPAETGVYTFSAMAKADGYDVVEATLGGQHTATVSNNTWEELKLSCEMQAGTAYHFRLAKKVNNTGTALQIQDVALYKGAVNRRENLLENGDFSGGSSGWSFSDTSALRVSEGALAIDGAQGQTRKASQTVNISGEAGELLTFGGSGKTNGLPNLDGWGRAQALSSLVLELHYTDQSTEKKTIHFFADSAENWLDIFGGIKASKAFSSVTFTVEYSNNANTSYFDYLRLYRGESYGTAYYYSDNQLMAEENPASGTSTYTYTEEGDIASVKDAKNRTTTYSYDENRNLTETRLNYSNYYSYDAYGNLTGVRVGKSGTEETMYTGEKSYNASGTAVAAETDARGQQTSYTVDAQTLLTTAAAKPEGSTETLSFYTTDTAMQTGENSLNGAVKSKTVTGAAGQMLSQIRYDYEKGRLSRIRRSSFDYVLSGNESASGTVTVDGKEQSLHTKSAVSLEYGETATPLSESYYDEKGQLIKSISGNQTNLFAYDELGRVTYSTNGVDSYRYSYSGLGQLERLVNTAAEEVYHYYYDRCRRLTSAAYQNRYGTSFYTRYGYSSDGQAEYEIYGVDGFSTGTHYQYNNDKTLSYIDFMVHDRQNNVGAQYSYDSFGRITEKKLISNNYNRYNFMGKQSYSYLENENGKTAVLSGYDFQPYRSGGYTLSDDHSTSTFTMDNAGNITQVNRSCFRLSDQSSYTYDGQNQLLTAVFTETTASPTVFSESYTYKSDTTEGCQGNLASRTVNGETYSYTYDSDWSDLLLSVKDANNQAVRSYTYDAVGNPLSDGVYNYVWSGGRLKEVRGATDNELIASYTYDANGLRSSKTIPGKRYEYYYSDGLLRMQKITTPENTYGATYLFYSYGESGLEWIEYYKEYDGNVEDNTLYWVEHNPQGMILTLYEYDLYGNYQEKNYTMRYTAFGESRGIVDGYGAEITQSSSAYQKLEELFSVRYKDYYYDNETGLYYLQNRYYDPFTCRFISPDSLIAEGQGTNSYNLFAYCGNNPVMYADPSGNAATISGLVLAFKLLEGWVTACTITLTTVKLVSSVIDNGWVGAMVVEVQEFFSSTVELFTKVFHRDEFEVDVKPKVLFGLLKIVSNYIDKLQLENTLPIGWMFDYASLIVEAIERDIGGKVDIDYIESSHMMQEALNKKFTGQYGK